MWIVDMPKTLARVWVDSVLRAYSTHTHTRSQKTTETDFPYKRSWPNRWWEWTSTCTHPARHTSQFNHLCLCVLYCSAVLNTHNIKASVVVFMCSSTQIFKEDAIEYIGTEWNRSPFVVEKGNSEKQHSLTHTITCKNHSSVCRKVSHKK